MEAKTILIIKDAYLSEEATGWIPTSNQSEIFMRSLFREIWN